MLKPRVAYILLLDAELDQQRNLVVTLEHWPTDIGRLISGYIGYSTAEKHTLWRAHCVALERARDAERQRAVDQQLTRLRDLYGYKLVTRAKPQVVPEVASATRAPEVADRESTWKWSAIIVVAIAIAAGAISYYSR